MPNLDQWKRFFETQLIEHHSTDGSHDVYHFERVWKLASRFASPENDMLVILAACYLHDLISYPKNHPRRSQSSVEAAKKARQLLIESSFPREKIDHVCHCIESHSYSASICPRTPEAQIVQDADRIEALGAIGIARTFYVAGLMNSKLFCSADPFAKNRILDDTKFAVDHFSTKLLKLPSQMNTAAGRIEAEKRVDIIKAFLQALNEEL